MKKITCFIPFSDVSSVEATASAFLRSEEVGKVIVVTGKDIEYKPSKPEYFYDGDHIESFIYSPEDSDKIITTTF